MRRRDVNIFLGVALVVGFWLIATTVVEEEQPGSIRTLNAPVVHEVVRSILHTVVVQDDSRSDCRYAVRFRTADEGQTVVDGPCLVPRRAGGGGELTWTICWEPLTDQSRDSRESIASSANCSSDDQWRVQVDGLSFSSPVVQRTRTASGVEFCSHITFDQPGTYRVRLRLQAAFGAWHRVAPRQVPTDHNTTTYHFVIPDYAWSSLGVEIDLNVSESACRSRAWPPALPSRMCSAREVSDGRWVRVNSPWAQRFEATVGTLSHHFPIPPSDAKSALWPIPMHDGRPIEAVWVPWSGCSLPWMSSRELSSCFDEHDVLVVGTSRERTLYYALMALLVGNVSKVDAKKVHTFIASATSAAGSSSSSSDSRWSFQWWSPWRDSNNGGVLMRTARQWGFCPSNLQDDDRLSSGKPGRRKTIIVTLQEHDTNFFYERDESWEFGFRPVVNDTNAIWPRGTLDGAFGRDCFNRSTDSGATCLHELEAFVSQCLPNLPPSTRVLFMSPHATQAFEGQPLDWNDANMITMAEYHRSLVSTVMQRVLRTRDPSSRVEFPYVDVLNVTRAALFGSDDTSHYYGAAFSPNLVEITVAQILSRALCK